MQAVQTIYQHQSAGFSESLLDKCSLNLFLDTGVLAFAIVAPGGRIVAVKEYSSPGADAKDMLAAALRNDSILSVEFAACHVTSGQLLFALVPAAEFEKGGPHAWSRILLAPDSADHLVESCPVPEADAVAVFTVPLSLSQACLRLHRPVFRPAAPLLLAQALLLAGPYPDLLLIHLLGSHAAFVVVRQRKLHYCNLAPVTSPADVLYFSQLALNASGADNDQLPVKLTGIPPNEADWLPQLQDLIPALNLPLDPLMGTFETQSEKLPHWKFAFLSF